MKLRGRRLIVAAPIAELLAVAVMVASGALILAFLDATVTARIIEMQRVAFWVAPAAGFVACALGGWWVARRPGAGEDHNGLALGIVVAVIDLALLVASGAPVGVLTLTSVVGRIAGGYCGGLLARRASRAAAAV